jgi:hypothetical protein
MRVVGIDLAGKEKNPTGFCILTEKGAETMVFYYDRDIVEETEKANPDVVAIDAPFTFAPDSYFREGERLLMEMGFRPLSPNFPNMKPLVIRARRLLKLLGRYKVIEVFPQASQKILGLAREKGASKDRFDALVCALTGKYYLEGKYIELGKEKIVIPKP